MRKKGISLAVLAALVVSVTAGATFMAAAQEGATPTAKAAETVYFTSDEETTIVYDSVSTKGEKGVTVTLNSVAGKDRVSFAYENYFTKESLYNGFIELSMMPTATNAMDFDYLVVTVEDAVDENQKLAYALAPQPVTSGWWSAWTAGWVSYTDNLTPVVKAQYEYANLLSITGTNQNLIGKNTTFLSSTNKYNTGPYLDCGVNVGAKNKYFVQENSSAKLDALKLSLQGNLAFFNDRLAASLLDEDFMKESKAGLGGTPYEEMYTAEYFNSLFSSGYCKLRVSYLGVNSDRVSCHIKSIGGQTFADNEGCKVVDDTPMIQMIHDTHAVKGRAFVMPQTTITDLREGDISSKATFAVKDSAGMNIPVNDGKVVFDKVGDYTLSCSVTLQSGGTFLTERTVKCLATMPTTSFSVDVTVNDGYKTGDTLAIPSAVATNVLSTAAGNAVKPAIYLQKDGETVAEYQCDGGVYYHRFDKAGNYQLAYVFQNAYGVVNSLTYPFTVASSLYVAPSYLPVSVFSGKATPLADCTVENFVDNASGETLYRGIYVNDELLYLAQGERVLQGSLLLNKSFEKTEKTVKISYKAGFSQNALTYGEEYILPVVHAGFAEDYVIVRNAEGALDRSNVAVVGYEESKGELIFTSSKTHSYTMPQPVSLEQLLLSFDVKQGYAAPESVDVELIDFYDDSKSLKFSVKAKDDSTSLLSVNGNYVGTISGSFANDKSAFEWRYDMNGSCLTDVLGKAITNEIKSWADGRDYDGFTEDICVVRFTVNAAGAESGFSIKRINNQAFSRGKYTLTDTSAPNIRVYGTLDKSVFAFGKYVEIPAAKAFDVLNPCSFITVTVIAPNERVVMENASCESAKKILINELGRWTITYTAHDGNDGFIAEKSYEVEVKDTVAPELFLQGTVASSYKVGTTVTFPAAKVIDNFTGNCHCYVIVIFENGDRTALKDGKYTFAKAGSYSVQYYAWDAEYNVVQKIFKVTVA